jgi:hypothetical protein
MNVKRSLARTVRRITSLHLGWPRGTPPEPDYPEAVREGLEYHWSVADEKENKELSPPSEESIELRAVLMVEAYTPSTSGNLIDWLKEKGWGFEPVAFSGPTLLNWVSHGRASSFGGGGVNAGLLVRPGTAIVDDHGSWNCRRKSTRHSPGSRSPRHLLLCCALLSCWTM